MLRETRSPERRTRRHLGLGLFFWGVLLSGCARRASDPAHAVQLPHAADPPRRLGRHIPNVTGQERLEYRVRVDPELTRVDVEVCPSGFRIERLNAPSPGAQRLLEAGRVITPQGDYTCPDDGVDLPLSNANECLHYAVNLPEQSPDPTSLRRAGTDRLASPDLWLWIATPRPEHLKTSLHFDLPEGVHAAVPWPSAAALPLPESPGQGQGLDPKPGMGTDFSVPETSFAWKSAGAFSHSPLVPLTVLGAELRLAVLGAGFAEHEREVRDWLVQGARAASLLFGRFPVPETLVIAVPSERSGPAFGMALRGGGPAVVIFLDRHASAATLSGDWTCTHEFLHLGVPRLPPEDAWLFEGLATYYTEITRARAGIISPRQAYQRLLEGFERGRRNGGSLTLRDESARMRERHAFYRVYWSGAALAFLTDIAARRAGGPTLDAALRSFAECCAASEDDWSAERVLARLDASLGAPRFATQAQRWLDRREFPELDAALRALGVASGTHGNAIFGRTAEAALRDAIMAPAAPSSPTERSPTERSPTEPQRQPHQPQ